MLMLIWKVQSQGSENEGSREKGREGREAVHGQVSLIIVMATGPQQATGGRADHSSDAPFSTKQNFPGQVVWKLRALEEGRDK